MVHDWLVCLITHSACFLNPFYFVNLSLVLLLQFILFAGLLWHVTMYFLLWLIGRVTTCSINPKTLEWLPLLGGESWTFLLNTHVGVHVGACVCVCFVPYRGLLQTSNSKISALNETVRCRIWKTGDNVGCMIWHHGSRMLAPRQAKQKIIPSAVKARRPQSNPMLSRLVLWSAHTALSSMCFSTELETDDTGRDEPPSPICGTLYSILGSKRKGKNMETINRQDSSSQTDTNKKLFTAWFLCCSHGQRFWQWHICHFTNSINLVETVTVHTVFRL